MWLTELTAPQRGGRKEEDKMHCMRSQGKESKKDRKRKEKEEKQGWRQQENEMMEKEDYNVSSTGSGQILPAGE